MVSFPVVGGAIIDLPLEAPALIVGISCVMSSVSLTRTPGEIRLEAWVDLSLWRPVVTLTARCKRDLRVLIMLLLRRVRHVWVNRRVVGAVAEK
jgi:hypothetical protein